MPQLIIPCASNSRHFTHSMTMSLHNNGPVSFLMYVAQILSNYCSDIIFIRLRSIGLIFSLDVFTKSFFCIENVKVFNQREQGFTIIPVYLIKSSCSPHNNIFYLISNLFQSFLFLILRILKLEDLEDFPNNLDYSP